LLKAGRQLSGKKRDALKYFTDIKDNYDASPEAASVDVLDWVSSIVKKGFKILV
jgi:hypothetical protein